MPVCGCGQQLAGSPPILSNGDDDRGIILSGTFDNTVITAADSVAWRPFYPGPNADNFQTINFFTGNAITSARFLRNGYQVDVILSMRFGTTTTWAASPWEINLPWDPLLGPGIVANHGYLGMWSAFDASAGLFYDGEVGFNPARNLVFRYGDDAGGSSLTLQQGTPFTFAATDELHLKVRFEGASN
jgi:hypothetical protein